MLSDLLDLIIVERCAQLVRGHAHVRAVAQPGFDLIAKSTLLELIHKALQVSEIRRRKHRRKQCGAFGCRHRTQNTLLRAAKLIKKSHFTTSIAVSAMGGASQIQGCFSFFAARIPWLVASRSHIYAPVFVCP